MDLLSALSAGEEIEAPVVMVVAHPDDEILGLGSRMPLMRDLTIVQLTDGAPRDMRDARREGYERWQEYAAARRDGCTGRWQPPVLIMRARSAMATRTRRR